jgi:hypothetical protein
MKHHFFPVLLLLMLIFISCEEETTVNIPAVFTGEVNKVNTDGATLTARISNPGNASITESGFYWGVHENEMKNLKLLNNSSEDIFSLKTDKELLPGKTYYVRAFAQTNEQTVWGRTVSFETEERMIDRGNWTKVLTTEKNDYSYISSSFNFENHTYLIFEEGEIYTYNHSTGETEFLLKNDSIRLSSFSCLYNKQAYIFVRNVFYRFNPETLGFTKLKSQGTPKGYGSSGFKIGDEIFIGLGTRNVHEYTKDFWSYNISTDEWHNLNDFPGDFRTHAFAFALDGKGFVGGGYNLIQGNWPYPKFTDMWSFNPENQEWKQKESLPVESREELFMPASNTGGFGYGLIKNTFYEYNSTYDIWLQMKSLPSSENFAYPHMFSYNNKIFVAEAYQLYGEPKNFNIWVYEK